jgi:mRNA-degrading endonuclease RelE of RelBE toxin-antitoxin system
LSKYKLKFTKTFQKHVKKFRKDKELVEELIKKIERLLENPEIGKPLRYALSKYRSVIVKKKYRLDNMLGFRP